MLARSTRIKRLIVVADCALLSLDNVDELAKISLPDGNPLEFILAVPGRCYGEFKELLAPIQTRASAATNELIEETRWQGWRLMVAHDPEPAKAQTQLRRERIATLQEKAQAWAGKLDGQDVGVKTEGRKLSDSGAKARLYLEVCEAHLARIVKVDLKSDLFSHGVDEGVLAHSELMDGKLLLVSNVADLSPTQLVQRHKALADIERGFRVLKSEIEIALVYRRLAERIRAHAMLCDEVHIGQSQKFLTLVHQIEADCVRLQWVGKDRTKLSFEKFLSSGNWTGVNCATCLEAGT